MKKTPVTLAQKRQIIDMLPFNTVRNISYQLRLPEAVVNREIEAYLNKDNSIHKQKASENNKYVIELYYENSDPEWISKKTGIPADKVEQIIVEHQHPQLLRWFFKTQTVNDIKR